MKIISDRRNTRYEHELEKLRKKKRDNLLTQNILTNKVNYICYILKSNHRNIINDINFENKNAIETCFYYCKPFITFLLLFYPYLNHYVKNIRSTNLRIYKNFYKYIIKKSNNFVSLLFKLKIKDEVTNKKQLLHSSTDSAQVHSSSEKNLSDSSKTDCTEELLLQNVFFQDIFSKTNFIKILFARIYVKKHQKSIFRILKILLFYFSLPTFLFSAEFFNWYHQKKRTRYKKSNTKRQNQKQKKKCYEELKKQTKKKNIIEKCRENFQKFIINGDRGKVRVNRLYFRVPFFDHIVIPTPRINNYDDNTDEFLKNKKTKIRVKQTRKNKKRDIKKKQLDPIDSTNSDSVSDEVDTEKSESVLSNTEDEQNVKDFLEGDLCTWDSVLDTKWDSNCNAFDTKRHFAEIKTEKNECVTDNYYENEKYPLETNPMEMEPMQYKNAPEKYINEHFSYFIKLWKSNNHNAEQMKKNFAEYVEKDFKMFLLNNVEMETEQRQKKNIYVHDLWRKKINFDDIDFNKNSLIHKACLVSNINIIFLLLNLNVNLIVYNDKNELPLHCTIYSCDKYIFLLMLHNTVEFLFFSLMKEYQRNKALMIHKNAQKGIMTSAYFENWNKEEELRDKTNYTEEHSFNDNPIDVNNLYSFQNEKREKKHKKKYKDKDKDEDVDTNTNINTDKYKDTHKYKYKYNRKKKSCKNKSYRYEKYIRNNFFYNENINDQFLHNVVKLYISSIVKIIELGNWEFLKILCNYNKYIFCYIMQNFDMCYFLCLVANMYNCTNFFLKMCHNVLKHSCSIKVKKRTNKRKMEQQLNYFHEDKVKNKNKNKDEYEKEQKYKCENNPYVNVDVDVSRKRKKTTRNCHKTKETNNNLLVVNEVEQKEEIIHSNLQNVHKYCQNDQNDQRNHKDVLMYSMNKQEKIMKQNKVMKKKKKMKNKKKNIEFIRNYSPQKKLKKSKIEILYSEECLKHIFVPEPTDYPYMRDQIKSNIPENSSRLDVLVSEKHGLLNLNSFVKFKLKKVNREANLSDILRVHDISYLKSLIHKMRKYKMDSYIGKDFLMETKKNPQNYVVTERENKEAADCIEQMMNLANLENNVQVYHTVKTERTINVYGQEIHSIENTKQLIDSIQETLMKKQNETNTRTDTGIGIKNAIKTTKEAEVKIVVDKKEEDVEDEEEDEEDEEEEEEEEEEENSEIKTKQKSEKAERENERIEKMLLLDGDTFINKYSFRCATHASGVVLSAVDYVFSKKEKAKCKSERKKNIFCAVRPPGHHLGTYGAAQFNLTDEDIASGSQGFCILNNIAIGAAYAKQKYDFFDRVAIVDFDIHHGNGTEQIIRNLGLKKIKVNEYIDIYTWKGWKNTNDRKHMFFSSIHAFDGYFYPGTGNDTVELEPYIINVTLKKNMNSKDFLTLFQNNILIHLFYFKPDILFLSAGFDGHQLDYVNNGFVKKTTSTYFYLTRLILSLQNKVPFPIISVLEGGYNTFNDMSSVFSLSVLEHLLAFYYNDVSYVAVKRNRGKKKDYKELGTNGITNEITNDDMSHKMTYEITNEDIHDSTQRNEKKNNNRSKKNKKNRPKKSSLKFPFIALSKEKVNEMFENYFCVFKEKTVESENFNLTRHSEIHKHMMEQFDKKHIIIERKISRFMDKIKPIVLTLFKKNKYIFSNIKTINLPYDSYFYDILSHFKISMKNKKNQFIANFFLKNAEPYFIALNDPSKYRDLMFHSIKAHPEKQFLISSLWKNNDT